MFLDLIRMFVIASSVLPDTYTPYTYSSYTPLDKRNAKKEMYRCELPVSLG
ncbi:hypothetical protein J6590_097789 [Homalodisca vitripennis]|nr:hypothetical protein J6590_097789 [Homalodisca vitripennis]